MRADVLLLCISAGLELWVSRASEPGDEVLLLGFVLVLEMHGEFGGSSPRGILRLLQRQAEVVPPLVDVWLTLCMDSCSAYHLVWFRTS